jgi:tellurite resistance protein TehA-like permease
MPRSDLYHFIPLMLRVTQTILTVTALILYATTYAITFSSSSSDADVDTSSYIYAIICCTITLLTLLVYTIPSFPTLKFFLWDFCVAVLWAALSGVFGMRYFRYDDDGQDGRQGGRQGEGKEGRQGDKMAMRAAVGIDLVVMGCWIITCLWGCVGLVRVKRQKKRQRREGKEVEKMSV